MNRPAGEPLPLAMFEAPCLFRDAAVTALDRAGIPWRIAYKPELARPWAAVEAGLGVTVGTPIGLPSSLTLLGEGSGLPALPMVNLSLHNGKRELTPAAARLKDILVEILDANLSAIAEMPAPMSVIDGDANRRGQGK